MKGLQQKIQPILTVPPTESSESLSISSPQLVYVPSRWFVGVLASIVGILSGFTVYERLSLRAEMTLAMTKTSQELEQLRSDVVLSTSENMTYLKIMVMKPGIDKQLARDIAHSLILRAREHHRDPDLVLAIIDVESDFNPHAVSPTGALGLMQIMPSWKSALAIDKDLRDVDTSINYGLKILGTYEQMFSGLELALTAYNKGPSQVTADMRAGRPPFNGYSESIMRTYARIKTWMRP